MPGQLYYWNQQKASILRVSLDGKINEEILSLEMPEVQRLCDPTDIERFTIHNDKVYIFHAPMASFSFDLRSKSIKSFIKDLSVGVFLDKKFYHIDHVQRTFFNL